MLATISFVQSPFLKLRMLNTKGVIKLCVIIITHVKRNTKIIVNVVARKKNMIMIMIGVKKTTIMTIITNVKKIATKVVVRKDSVIAVTGITKRNDSAGKVEF